MRKSLRLKSNLWLMATVTSLVTLAACSPEQPPQLGGAPEDPSEGRVALDEEEQFRFELSAEELFELQVMLDGEPLGFANVSLTDSLIPDPEGKWMEEPSGGNVYFRGVTNAEGRVSATIRLPTRVDAVDLVVDRAGATGPYTSETLREYWGPFAPSSRITLFRAFLGQLELDLESS